MSQLLHKYFFFSSHKLTATATSMSIIHMQEEAIWTMLGNCSGKFIASNTSGTLEAHNLPFLSHHTSKPINNIISIT